MHEKFCQLVASGKTKKQAFLEARDPSKPPLASDAAIRSSATILMNIPGVRERIAELTERMFEAKMAAAVQQDALTRQWVIDGLIDNIKRAKSGDRFDGAAANRAYELLGKEIGMFVDRQENVNRNYAVRDEPFTEEEWREQFARPN